MTALNFAEAATIIDATAKRADDDILQDGQRLKVGLNICDADARDAADGWPKRIFDKAGLKTKSQASGPIGDYLGVRNETTDPWAEIVAKHNAAVAQLRKLPQ